MKMAGRKNIYQQNGVIPNALGGNTIWERNEQFMKQNITVYCQLCGLDIEMPDREDSTRNMDTYQFEMQNRVHWKCARERMQDNGAYR